MKIGDTGIPPVSPDAPDGTPDAKSVRPKVPARDEAIQPDRLEKFPAAFDLGWQQAAAVRTPTAGEEGVNAAKLSPDGLQALKLAPEDGLSAAKAAPDLGVGAAKLSPDGLQALKLAPEDGLSAAKAAPDAGVSAAKLSPDDAMHAIKRSPDAALPFVESSPTEGSISQDVSSAVKNLKHPR